MRNLRTGYVSPLFHVVFDELFITVHSLEENNDKWINLFTNKTDYYGPTEHNEEEEFTAFPELTDDWLPVAELPRAKKEDLKDEVEGGQVEFDNNTAPTSNVYVEEDSINNESPPDPIQFPQRSKWVAKPYHNVEGDEWESTPLPTIASRSIIMGLVSPLSRDDLFIHSLDCDLPFRGIHTAFNALKSLHTDVLTGEEDWPHPFALATKANGEDTPRTLRDIMKNNPGEQAKWYEAMDIELKALNRMETFVQINRSQVPRGEQIVQSSWAFRRKRRPNGLVYKYKARFVVRGDLQHLEDTDRTYSPVVDWSSIHLLFVVLAAPFGLKSKTIDFNAAFVHATLPKPIYIELPPGYTATPGKDKNVLKSSKKCLYGGVKRAAKLWYKHLSVALVEKMGFTKSVIDSCLYYKD